MLCIRNIKFMSKVEGLLDRMNAPQVVLRIVMDNNFIIPQLLGNTQQNITNWYQHLIPPIELSSYVDTYKIQFNIYREGIMIGTGTTLAKYNQTRKDVIDVIDKNNINNGKLVYELSWIRQYKGQYVKYEQYLSMKNHIMGKGGKDMVVKQQIKVQKVNNYKRQEGAENCFCACFAVRKKKTMQPKTQIFNNQPYQNQYYQNNAYSNKQSVKMLTQKQQKVNSANVNINQNYNKGQQMNQKPGSFDKLSKFRNIPIVYYQQQLQQGRLNDVQNLNRLNYYSKSYVVSK